MRLRIASLVLGGMLAIGVSAASAVPITYRGTLTAGVPVTGINSQAPGDFDLPAGAEYWRFAASAGSTVNVVGDRLAGHYDMVFWIFAGTFTDTNAFGSFFGFNDPGFIGYYDDQDPPNLAGPFGDPHATFVAPVGGFYTVAITNSVSSQAPPNPYRLQATGITVPEPSSLALFAAAAVFARRRLRATQEAHAR